MTTTEKSANQALISEFEAGRAPGDFHHADHVRVAFAYLSELPISEAIARFSSALQGFAASHGKSNLYSETITLTYMLLIAERLATYGARSWTEFSQQNSDLLTWKGRIPERRYSTATLEP